MISPRHAPALVLLSSLLALGAAFASQYIGGLEPCPLCILQRYPYGATIGLSLAALILGFAGVPRPVPWLVGLCGAAFAIGGAIALFHVGVEQHWWTGTAACGGGALEAATIEELRRQIMSAPVVRCDQVPWSLFGVSMAGYNALASVTLAGLSFIAAAMLARVARVTVER